MLSWEEFTSDGARPAAHGADHRRRRRQLRHRLRRDVARAGQRHARSRSWCSTPAPTPTPAARPRRRASPARTPTCPASAAPTTASTRRRKELGLLASFHPNVFACATSTAMHGHFLQSTMRMLEYPAPAVMDVYTPCGGEHGISESSSNARARLAVESRMHPLFVHDPRRGSTLHDWFSLEGNPDIDKTWTTSTLEYLDDDGQLQLLTTPLTPAEFALGEVRFKKQFRRLAPDRGRPRCPIDEYVELPLPDREGPDPVRLRDRRRPAPDQGRLLGLDRRPGRGPAPLLADAAVPLRRPRGPADRAAPRRLRGAEVAVRRGHAAAGELAGRHRAGDVGAGDVEQGARPASAAVPWPACDRRRRRVRRPLRRRRRRVGVADAPVWLDPADEPLCNDCGTCYQELPQFFEKTTMIIDGEARQVAQMIPGAARHRRGHPGDREADRPGRARPATRRSSDDA